MGDPSDDSSLLDRIHSWAKTHASNRSTSDSQRSVLPLSNPSATSRVNGPDPSSRSTTANPRALRGGSEATGSTRNNVADDISAAAPPPAPPPNKTQAQGEKPTPIEEKKSKDKPDTLTRMKNGSIRFASHTKEAVFHSWLNVLLVFVPIGIAVNFAGLSPEIIFAMNAVAIVPLAGLLSHATESVASRLGDTIGALLNVTFGNAVELIIFMYVKPAMNEIRIVQASLLGSILANLLLILGMAFTFGGLRFREQIYNSTVTQMSACLLSLSVMSLLLPTAFHASFADTVNANNQTLKVSRGTSVVLLLVYILYLLFQLKSHAYLYESTPQQIIDEESHPGVLADMLGSSSSSSSSDDSSSSDSDTTSGSHTTAKRIKRAFTHRRRRKSSVSSQNTPSVPSVVSSPSTETHRTYFESHQTAPGNGGNDNVTRQGSVLGAILSGDEADTDGENERRQGDPRIRDFENEHQTEDLGPSNSRSTERKHKKSTNKKHSKRSGKYDRRISEKESFKSASKVPPVEQTSQSQVAFAQDVQVEQDNTGARRPFNLRQLSGRPNFRPALPKVLSNNVFSTPPPSGSPSLGAIPSRAGPAGVRRVSSLPDRLNRTQTVTSTAPRVPIPPYTRQVASSERPAAGEDEVVKQPGLTRTAAVVLLLISTGLVALCAECLVDAIPEMIAQSTVSQAFIGLIILPIVGNAAEHVTAVTVAAKNKMDLAIGVAVGSSIQIALFVTPLVVLLGWCLNKDMTLYFNIFETISLFVTAFVVNFLVLDGRSNYLEGTLLIAAYVIIAVAAFFYPDGDSLSQLGGSDAVDAMSIVKW